MRHHSEDWIQSLTAFFDRLLYEPFTVATMNGNSSAAFRYLGRPKLSALARRILPRPAPSGCDSFIDRAPQDLPHGRMVDHSSSRWLKETFVCVSRWQSLAPKC